MWDYIFITYTVSLLLPIGLKNVLEPGEKTEVKEELRSQGGKKEI